jgi:ABC-type multidrug transport system ATPase subunit
MNIILFGPPGVGKSTLIGILKTDGYRAIDLEDIYPSKFRFQLPNMVGGVVFGGADLNPQRSYPNTIKMFLSLPQDKYEARRAARDEQIPSKKHQSRHLISDWLNGAKYDFIVDANRSKRATANTIRRVYDEANVSKT